MLLSLAFKSLLNRRATVLLTLITIALSTALLLGVQQVREQSRAAFFNSVSGTDLIVGARSGPVQLLLYSVFHIGNATSNIPWSSQQQLANDSRIAWTIPLSLGDSHQGYRVVGTSTAMFEHFRYGQGQPLDFNEGHAFKDLFDVVVGAEVAARLGYSPGDQLVIAHGSGNTSFMKHDNLPFTVSGVLNPTGTPLDRALLVSLEGLQAVHLGWRAGVPLPGLKVSEAMARQQNLTPRDVTAVLVGLKSKLQTFHLQRALNTQRGEPLTAVMPGLALQELWQIVGVAEKSLLLVAGAALLIGLIGMLALLLVGMQQRQQEIAVLRALGCPPWKIALLLIWESTLLTAAGTLLGVLLLQALLFAVRTPLLETFGIYLNWVPLSSVQWLQCLGILMLGTLAGMIPAVKGWRQARVQHLIRHY